MKKSIIVLLSLILAINISGQDLDYARKIIDTLTSSTMYGRGYVNNGDKKAAQFIENEFKSLGVDNFLESYQQNFEIDINTFGFNSTLRINNFPLILGKDYLINASSGSGEGKVKVISFDDFQKSKNVSNKALLFTEDEFKLMLNNKLLFNKALKSKIIIKKVSKLTASLSQNRWPLPPVVEIIDNRMLNVKKITFNIQSELKKNYITQNVIAHIKGELMPDSFIIFCAHYDHLGGMGNIFFPGANDNAAGIAMLFELAKYYQKNNPKYSVLFIAFGAEEVGLLGSKYFVKNSPIDVSKINFVFNVDLVGTGSEGVTVVNGKVYKNDFDKLIDINSKYKLLPSIKARGRAANSDHHYFTEKDVPSFFMYAMGPPYHYHNIYDDGSDLMLDNFQNMIKLITLFFE